MLSRRSVPSTTFALDHKLVYIRAHGGSILVFFGSILHLSRFHVSSQGWAVPMIELSTAVEFRNKHLYCPMSGHFSLQQFIFNDGYCSVFLQYLFQILTRHIFCICSSHFLSAGQWAHLPFVYRRYCVGFIYLSDNTGRQNFVVDVYTFFSFL